MKNSNGRALRLHCGALAAILLLSACTSGSNTQETVTALRTDAPSIDTGASTAPPETTQTSAKTPVYWLGKSLDGLFLYREFRDAEGEENAVAVALRFMMEQKPLDPDFFTAWQSPQKLAASISGQNAITVDVSSDAFSGNIDEDAARLAVQQLVYTASAAAYTAGLVDSSQPAQVTILVDGRTDQKAFGTIPLGSPIQRDPKVAARLWIIDPQEGVRLNERSLEIFGRAVTGGDDVEWELYRKDASGDEVVYRQGNLTSQQDPDKIGEFNVTVDVVPGSYVLKLLSTVGGEGTSVWDTKSFTVSE